MILVIITASSCHKKSNEEIVIDYYKNGKVKTKTFVGDTLRVKAFFNNEKNGIKTDIICTNDTLKNIKYYNPNGYLRKEGVLLNDSILIGKWKLYKDRQLQEIIEFKNIKNKSYLNQNWIFNENGDTIGGNYYHKKYEDTVILGQKNRIHIYLDDYSISEKSNSYLLVPKYGYNLDPKFTNQDQIPLDTIKNLSDKNMNVLELNGLENDVFLDIYSKEIGKNTFRAILINKIVQTKEILKQRKYYIEFDYFVPASG